MKEINNESHRNEIAAHVRALTGLAVFDRPSLSESGGSHG